MLFDALLGNVDNPVVTPTAVFLAPIGAESVFRRVARALRGVDIVYRQFDGAGELGEGFLAREAQRLISEALTRPAHLVAHSGGASVALLIAAKAPQRLLSLTLIEPPWIGNDLWSPEEQAFREGYDALGAVAPEGFWEAFARLFAPDSVEVPRDPAPGSGTLQKEMMMGIWRIYRGATLDRGSLRAMTAPVLLPYGGRSGAHARAVARVLAAAFPVATMECFEEYHHFDLPYRGGEQLADSLERLWGLA